ncbi:hypothetical protein ABPG72_007903 [Tetrahymena utriculariae]
MLQINDNRDIIVKDTNVVIINNSQFSNNIGIDGSSFANVGAIYLLDSNNTVIKKNTLFKNNTAQIGGAMRIQYTLQLPANNLFYFENIKAQFQGNKGFIFGNDVGTYIKKYLVYQSSETNSEKSHLVFTGYMFKQNINDLILQNIKSGGNINLKIKFFDQSNRDISTNKLSFINNNYPDSIMKNLCPEGSQSCYKGQIFLQKGYWRENNHTDNIFQQGPIRSLCKTCDLFGNVWLGKSYSQGSQQYESLNIGTQFTGQSIGIIVDNTQCLYKYFGFALNNQNELKIRSLLYFILPIIVICILLDKFLITNTFLKNKKHKFYKWVLIIIVFFFFQPNCIALCVSTLVADKLVATLMLQRAQSQVVMIKTITNLNFTRYYLCYYFGPCFQFIFQLSQQMKKLNLTKILIFAQSSQNMDIFILNIKIVSSIGSLSGFIQRYQMCQQQIY